MLLLNVAIHILIWWFTASFAAGLGWVCLCLTCRMLLRRYPLLRHLSGLRLGA
jgi:hypothetical protein